MIAAASPPGADCDAREAGLGEQPLDRPPDAGGAAGAVLQHQHRRIGRAGLEVLKADAARPRELLNDAHRPILPAS